MARAVTLSAQPLYELAQKLGISQSKLNSAETHERIASTFTVQSAALASVPAATVEAFFDTYGDAAELEIRTGDLPEVECRGALDPRWESLMQSAKARAGGTYDVILVINKTKLPAGPHLDSRIAKVVFFSPEAFQTILSAGPTQVAHTIWKKPDEPLTVILLDGTFEARGPNLVVAGASYVDAPGFTAPSVQDGLTRMALRRADYIGWDTELEMPLTPQHFGLTNVTGTGSDAIVSRLDTLMMRLALLYTCDRARLIRRDDGSRDLIAEYRGREHVAFVPVGEKDMLTPLRADDRRAVIDIVAWCYEEPSQQSGRHGLSDRLPFLQTRIAQLLESRPETDRFAMLSSITAQTADGVKWHWRAFIDGRVKEYLSQVVALEQAVATAVDKLADQVNELVKRASDTALAAVGVLIGSLLAAAFKDPFNDDLFRIGVFVYSGYTLLFPGLLGLAAAYGQASAVQSAFDRRKAALNLALDPTRVDEIIGGRVREASVRVRRWVAWLAIGYLLTSVAGFLAAYWIPAHISEAHANSALATRSNPLALPTSSTPRFNPAPAPSRLPSSRPGNH